MSGGSGVLWLQLGGLQPPRPPCFPASQPSVQAGQGVSGVARRRSRATWALSVCYTALSVCYKPGSGADNGEEGKSRPCGRVLGSVRRAACVPRLCALPRGGPEGLLAQGGLRGTVGPAPCPGCAAAAVSRCLLSLTCCFAGQHRTLSSFLYRCPGLLGCPAGTYTATCPGSSTGRGLCIQRVGLCPAA